MGELIKVEFKKSYVVEMDMGKIVREIARDKIRYKNELLAATQNIHGAMDIDMKDSDKLIDVLNILLELVSDD